jgi:hypothetical protein
MTRHCTKCGEAMVVDRQFIDAKTTYDSYTGNPIVTNTEITILRCPHYESGYSDQFWSVHDELILKELK